jgi:hypothetical protein
MPEGEHTAGEQSPSASHADTTQDSQPALSTYRDTNDARLSPAAVGALERGSHHLGLPSALERIVDTPATLWRCQPDNYFLDRLVVVVWIDAVSGPELAGYCKLARVLVNCKNPLGTPHLRALDDSQADGTQTKHCDGRTSLDIARVPRSTKTGGHAASQQRAHI